MGRDGKKGSIIGSQKKGTGGRGGSFKLILESVDYGEIGIWLGSVPKNLAAAEALQ